ncbi:acyltransferase family protein [Micromonospora sp. LOL_024]|uniref:acyltransferase family protein n=1 Tax=Micromonospora sp. LOL_024 TaxID=3345412 RepID=UPI003A884FE9
MEGLRALAVVLVLIGHASQNLLPGGFVGVDVFFVISGFLITGLLVTELERTGRISLVAFYARRAKRLLPAALVVLTATLLLTFAFLPRTRWSTTGWDVVYSGLYAMNWRLAEQSVDYLAVNRAPSALQHFWSLAVEEQFYLVWPLLLVAVAWLVRHRLRTGHLAVALTLVAVPSFAWSVWMTADESARAYFVTTTRMWELAVGGFIALFAHQFDRLHHLAAAGLAWLGLAAIITAAVMLRPETAFPGYAALGPTLGTAAVIAGGLAAGRLGPAALLDVRPVRAVGALSYSLYLWHWPLLVVAEARLGELTALSGAVVIALSVVPAILTYRLIENPIRRSPALSWRPARALQLGAACTGVAVLAGLAFQFTVWPPPSAPAPPALGAPAPSGSPSGGTAESRALGAAALGDNPAQSEAGQPVNQVATFIPDPLVAAQDGPDTQRDGCHQDMRGSEVKSCGYGDPDSGFTVALAGDSHAAQWLPALQQVATDRKWRLRTYTKSSCPYIKGAVALDSRRYDSCVEWNDKLRAALTGAERPDVLVVSTSFYLMIRDGRPVTQDTRTVFADALRSTWAEIASAQVPVIVLRDTPYHSTDIAECVSANPGRLTRCASPRSEVLAAGGGPAHEAAATRNDNVHLVDLNEAICPQDRCAPVIGGVLVYRDNNHLTATYVRTLAPRLSTALDRLL